MRTVLSITFCSLLSPATAQEVTFPVAPASAEAPLWYAKGDYLLSHEAFSQSPSAKIDLYHMPSKTRRSIAFWPPEATVAVSVSRVEPLPDGRVIVGARMISPSNQRAETISVFAADGTLKSRFRTNPFSWNDFALDNKSSDSLWLFGACPEELSQDCGDVQTLRRYSFDGALLESYLPLSEIAQSPLAPWVRSGVFVLPDRLAVYLPVTQEVAYVSRKGQILERQKLNLPELAQSSLRLALDDQGAIYSWSFAPASLSRWNSVSRAFEILPGSEGGLFCGIQDGKALFVGWKFGELTRLRYLTLPTAGPILN